VTRFAWLQSRTQTVVAAGIFAALAVACAITGIHLSHLFHNSVVPCKTGCAFVDQQFTAHEAFMNHLLDILGRVVPALIGLFWGAPLLAREFETGTFRLAWTQSVTRARWTITKLGVGALATVLLAGLVTLTITWWYRALDPLSSNKYAIFDRRDLVPIGYALFAFAAGALLGAIIRRTVPAMAATLGVFVFARVAVAIWVRPHLLTPITRTESLASGQQFGIASTNGAAPAIIAQGQGPSNSWTISSHILTAAGQPATLAQRTSFVSEHCPTLATLPRPVGNGPGGHAVAAPSPRNGNACIHQAEQAFRLSITYLPAGRYWTLQVLETGIFVGLALLCAIGCFWWVTRRTD
jgi:ABC-type transport system involved in multi-copper enzyme maturation permease subunit